VSFGEVEVIEAVRDELYAWRWLAERFAAELGVGEASVRNAVGELVQLVGVVGVPANVRSHRRNRIYARVLGREPLSGGRRRSERW
jgi:hypothetical protein